MPQQNQRATSPQAPEQGPAAKPGGILRTQPLFHPAEAAVLRAALPHSQPVWDERLPALRKEAGLGSAGYPKLFCCIFFFYKCLTLRGNIVISSELKCHLDINGLLRPLADIMSHNHSRAASS